MVKTGEQNYSGTAEKKGNDIYIKVSKHKI